MFEKSPRKTLDETDYTSTLKSAIEIYLTNRGEDPRVLTPGAQYQGARKLDVSYPFDLIARLNEYSLLILEIKIADEKRRLTSFKSAQRKLASALFEAGVPLWYCYNLDRSYEGKLAEATLKLSNTAEPKLVCDEEGRLSSTDSHKILKLRIDELLKPSGNHDTDDSDDNGARPDGNAIGAFFSNEVIASVRDLNTRLLFFLYHTKSKEILYFEKEQLEELVHHVERRYSLKSIDFCTASCEEMAAHFREKIKELARISAEIREEIRERQKQQIRGTQHDRGANVSPIKQRTPSPKKTQSEKQRIQIQL
jgi:uncharacterized protein YlbG (UPF0298 family)